MKTCTTARRLARAPQGEPLDELATVIESAADTGGWGEPPHLVSVTFDGENIELGMKPLNHHPALELTGFNAPKAWSCLGVLTEAWAGEYEPTRGEPRRGSMKNRRRTRLLHLVSRSGDAVMLMRDEQSGDVRLTHIDTAASAGLLDDCLRRSLGIPTAPPADDTRELWALLWLDHVLEDAVENRLSRASWQDVARLHPAVERAIAADDPALVEWSTTELVRAGEVMANAYQWERARGDSLDGAGPISGIPADHLRWMDEGMFARSVVAWFPPLDDVLADLEVLIPGEVHRRIVDTLAGWGLMSHETS